MGNELVTCQERTFKECQDVKGHPEMVKNVRNTSGKFAEFVATTSNFVTTLKNEAVGAIRYGAYNAWVAAGATRALLGVRGRIWQIAVTKPVLFWEKCKLHLILC